MIKFKTTIYKMLLVVALALAMFSCETDNSLVKKLPADPEAIADQIASTDLFQETASVLKEMHFLMLSDIHNGATALTSDEAAKLDSSDKEVEATLKSKNYKNAAKLAELTIRSNSLRQQMIAELRAIRAEIGDDKFAQVDKFISSKYGYMYKVSFEEAFTLVK